MHRSTLALTLLAIAAVPAEAGPATTSASVNQRIDPQGADIGARNQAPDHLAVDQIGRQLGNQRSLERQSFDQRPLNFPSGGYGGGFDRPGGFGGGGFEGGGFHGGGGFRSGGFGGGGGFHGGGGFRRR